MAAPNESAWLNTLRSIKLHLRSSSRDLHQETCNMDHDKINMARFKLRRILMPYCAWHWQCLVHPPSAVGARTRALDEVWLHRDQEVRLLRTAADKAAAVATAPQR